jgi:betaine-aldehyde dehydrogenase
MSATDVRTYGNVVGGEVVDGVEGALEDVLAPATEEVIARVPLGTVADVERAVGAAVRAQEAWGDTTPAERATALLELAKLLDEHAQELADLEALNAGKPRAAALEELPLCSDHLRFFAGAARLLEGKAAGEYVTGHTSMVRREPVGVVGQITPWNYPLAMAVWKIGPALAAGNSIVLKPSELTPLTTIRMAELALEVLPEGVLNVVTGHGDPVGAGIVRHPAVRMVSLTGSVGTGQAIARAAADTLARVHLELGGKAPVVVLDDADVDAVVANLRVSAFFNAGQDCTAASRVLASRAIADELAAALAEQAQAVRFSRDEEPDSDDLYIPPINNADQLAKVSGLVDRLPSHARLLTGGSAADGAGYFYTPTVVAGVKQDDEIAKNEIFGPIITVQTFADEAEALELANDTPYGLSSSVFTTDHSRAIRMSRALEFGCVWINTHIPLVAEMPHGGFKESGYGKDLSNYSLEDYTRVKHVMSAVSDA